MAYTANKKLINLEAKATPIDADVIVVGDTADTDRAKKTTFTQLKAFLKTYLDTLYQPLATVLTNTTASFTTAQETKLSGIEALADVTSVTNVTAAGALMDSEVDVDLKTFSLPANTTISTFGATLVDDADAGTARSTLDVDQAGTDNSTDVTISTANGLSIIGQAISMALADTSTIGSLSNTDWNTFNNKASTTAPTFATSITGSYLTASEMLGTDASKNIVSLPVATYPSLTELSYVKGLTSAVQTQLGAKAPIADPTFTGEIGIGSVNVSETELGILEGATVTTTELNLLDGITTLSGSNTGDEPDASTTVKGIVELATDAEMTTGTDTTRAITPANAKVELDKKANLAGATFTGAVVAPDHGTATTDEVVNVCYGTSATPPTASTTTEGTIYIQYTA